MSEQPAVPSAFPLPHVATAPVDAPAEAVFAFLADPAAPGEWSPGCLRAPPAVSCAETGVV